MMNNNCIWSAFLPFQFMKLKALGVLSAAAMFVLIALPSRADAGIIVAMEDLMVPDTRGSALNVDAYFDLAADVNIFNSTTNSHVTVSANYDKINDIDWFSFTGTAGFTLDLDIDTDPNDIFFEFDSALHLFDASGTLLAFNDDSGLDLGSESNAARFDSFIGTYVLPYTGTYYIAVSSFDNISTQASDADDTFFLRPDSMRGGSPTSMAAVGIDSFTNEGEPDDFVRVFPYNLHRSIGTSGAVPEPTSLAIFGTICFVASHRRRQV